MKAKLSGGLLSSDGGVLLLRETDRHELALKHPEVLQGAVVV